MTVTILAMTSINSDAKHALEKYLQVVQPLMQLAGAKIVSRIQVSESVVGTSEFQYVTIVEYPDEASVKKVFDSEEYKSLDEVKQLAFSKYQVHKTILL